MGYQDAKSITQIAGAAIAIRRFVKVSGANVIQGAAGADDCTGVSMSAAAALGDAISMARYNGGIVEVEGGAAVAAGVAVTTDATGRAVAATTGNRINGYSRNAIANAGEVLDVELVKGGTAA